MITDKAGLAAFVMFVRANPNVDPDSEEVLRAFEAYQAAPPAPVPVESASRRPETPNIASPHLQKAFIDEARVSMGAPSEAFCWSCLGKFVEIKFNDERPSVRGLLTRIVNHPANVAGSPLYLMLDDDKDFMFPLNAIQSLTVKV